MYCTRKVTDDIIWVGADDRRLSLFEGTYSVPRGVSYNSYVILDEKTALLDTIDKAVSEVFLQNVEHTLAGRPLDYLVIHHMEPDHSYTMMQLLDKHPETTVVVNRMILGMIKQFFGVDLTDRALVVAEGDKLALGKHELTFVMAPMVHWPEVMVSYDPASKALFSADAFGTFGALNGAIFADELDFEHDYLDEARRYYTNIVGKYGAQVTALLKKAAGLDIEMICPLHGPVWRKNLRWFIDKYTAWAGYIPEKFGVVIAYGTIYGNTENAANILACRLSEMGVPVVMYDTSVTHASEIIAACFKYSHLVFASSSYNAGLFVDMENFLHDLAAHGIRNRTVAIMQNGSWAPSAAAAMKKILEPLKDIRYVDNTVNIKSSLAAGQEEEIKALAEALAG